jgi:hypothetical protein
MKQPQPLSCLEKAAIRARQGVSGEAQRGATSPADRPRADEEGSGGQKVADERASWVLDAAASWQDATPSLLLASLPTASRFDESANISLRCNKVLPRHRQTSHVKQFLSR